MLTAQRRFAPEGQKAGDKGQRQEVEEEGERAESKREVRKKARERGRGVCPRVRDAAKAQL